jgi:adenylate cyclase
MGADDVHESELIRGKEIEIVILRAAIHGISDLATSAKPYDTVFILNRYLRAVRTEIEATGGRIDKYDARGFTALYGIDKPISEAARDALESAKAVHRRVEELNSRSFDESSKPLRVSIGLHTGRAVIGELSYGEERHLAALGEAVETTDRFERLGYANGGLTVSDTLAGVIGLDLSTYESTELSTAGNGDPRQRAYFIGDPADLVLGEA